MRYLSRSTLAFEYLAELGHACGLQVVYILKLTTRQISNDQELPQAPAR